MQIKECPCHCHLNFKEHDDVCDPKREITECVHTIDKEKFLEAFNYLRAINNTKLKHLDFSELFIDNPNMEEAIKEFGFVGLSNEDFITSDYPFRYGIKRKFKLFKKVKI